MCAREPGDLSARWHQEHDGELWFSAAATELSLAKSAVIVKHPCLETSRGHALRFLLVRQLAVSAPSPRRTPSCEVSRGLLAYLPDGSIGRTTSFIYGGSEMLLGEITKLALSSVFAFKSLTFRLQREGWHGCFHAVFHTALVSSVFP